MTIFSFLARMVHTGGLFTVIGKKPVNEQPKVPEINIYSVCSKFPDSGSLEMLFDAEIRIYLMDG